MSQMQMSQPSAQNASSNLQVMLDKIKSKVSNPFLKDNFTLENIANFFANFVAGNEFVNNLEVKDMAEMNKLEIKEMLKVKNEAQVENLSFNKLKSRAMSIDDNEITFDPEAVLKLRNSKIAFKVKDVFEVITFMKYIVKICGSKLERCDFNTLIKNRSANQLLQLISAFEKKQNKLLKTETDKIKIDIDKAVKSVNSIESAKNLEKKEINFQQKTQNNLRKENTNKKDNQNSSSQNFNELEKELNMNSMNVNMPAPQINQNNLLNEDYEKFMQSPQMSDYMNNYYYATENDSLNNNLNK